MIGEKGKRLVKVQRRSTVRESARKGVNQPCRQWRKGLKSQVPENIIGVRWKQGEKHRKETGFFFLLGEDW